MRQTAGNFMKNATVKQIADNCIKKIKISQPYGKIHFQRNIDSVMLETGVAKKSIKVCGYLFNLSKQGVPCNLIALPTSSSL